MSAVVLVGSQWGDEGKGKITDYLAEKAAALRQQGLSPISIPYLVATRFGATGSHPVDPACRTGSCREVPLGKRNLLRAALEPHTVEGDIGIPSA